MCIRVTDGNASTAAAARPYLAATASAPPASVARATALSAPLRAARGQVSSTDGASVVSSRDGVGPGARATASGRGAGRGRGPAGPSGRLRGPAAASSGAVAGAVSQRRRRRRRRRRFGRNEGRRCRRHTIVILSRLLQRDLGVREELARRLQHRGVPRDAGLVLGVRLDERVEDGPLLLEPVLPAWTPIA